MLGVEEVIESVGFPGGAFRVSVIRYQDEESDGCKSQIYIYSREPLGGLT